LGELFDDGLGVYLTHDFAHAFADVFADSYSRRFINLKCHRTGSLCDSERQ